MNNTVTALGFLTLLAALWFTVTLLTPGLTDWAAEWLENWARLLRRHAAAMRAAYAAYAASWREQKTV